MADDSEGGRMIGECSTLVVLALTSYYHAVKMVVEDPKMRRLINKVGLSRFDDLAGRGKGVAKMRKTLGAIFTEDATALTEEPAPAFTPPVMNTIPDAVHAAVQHKNIFYAASLDTDVTELEDPALELMGRIDTLDLEDLNSSPYPLPMTHVDVSNGTKYVLLTSAILFSFDNLLDIKFQIDELKPPTDIFTRSRYLLKMGEDEDLGEKVWIRGVELIETTLIRYWAENLTKKKIDHRFRRFYVVRNQKLIEISEEEYHELEELKGLRH